MAALAEAFVAVRADTSKVRPDIESGFSGVDADGQGRSVGSRFGAGLKATLAGAAAGLATAGIVEFGRSSIEAFKGAEESQRALSDAYERFPAIASVNREAFDALNSAIQAKTGFDDDDLAASEAKLAQYGLTGEQIQKLTPLVADYAAKTGVDAGTATDQLGKALLGSGRALKTVGIDFQDAGTVAGNFDQIVGGLSKQVGGFAEGQAQTAAGQSRVLATEFENLQETVGGALVPILQRLTSVGLSVVGWIQQNIPLVTALGTVVTGLGLVYAATSAWIALSTAGTTANTIVMGIARAATLAWTGVQWALNLALSANPIALVVIGIAALVAALIYAWNNSETFRNIVLSVWAAIRGAVSAAIGWLTTAIPAAWEAISSTTVAVWGRISGFFTSIWSTIRSTVAGAADAVRGAVSAAWDGIVGTVSGAVGRVVDAVNGLQARIVGALSGAATWLVDTGRSIVEGLVAGVRGMAGALVSAIVNLIPGPVQAVVKSALGIASPSKVMQRLGEYTVQGFIQGLGVGDVAGAMGRLVSVPAPAFAGGLAGVGASSVGGSVPLGGPVRLHPDDIHAIGVAAGQAVLVDRGMSSMSFTAGR